ncbi:uncharacterized protein C2orf16-like [Phymastichus coffea]|uniref:uncharacterized protein C2orf16-like n=1 Tax=Phymastichus coffea TaxID=108790 RepID=UPI00273B70CC|nr:uncharacterized protein C2orf16-like [Phymastichus coffea]
METRLETTSASPSTDNEVNHGEIETSSDEELAREVNKRKKNVKKKSIANGRKLSTAKTLEEANKYYIKVIQDLIPDKDDVPSDPGYVSPRALIPSITIHEYSESQDVFKTSTSQSMSNFTRKRPRVLYSDDDEVEQTRYFEKPLSTFDDSRVPMNKSTRLCYGRSKSRSPSTSLSLPYSPNYSENPSSTPSLLPNTSMPSKEAYPLRPPDRKKSLSRHRSSSRHRSPSRHRSQSRHRSPSRHRSQSRHRSPSRHRSSHRSRSRHRSSHRSRSHHRSPSRYRSRSQHRSPSHHRSPSTSRSRSSSKSSLVIDMEPTVNIEEMLSKLPENLRNEVKEAFEVMQSQVDSLRSELTEKEKKKKKNVNVEETREEIVFADDDEVDSDGPDDTDLSAELKRLGEPVGTNMVKIRALIKIT